MTKRHIKKTYVDKKKLLEDIRDYQKKCVGEDRSQHPQIPDSIGRAILNIATGLARKPRWNRYTYKDEMINDAVMTCLAAVLKFNPDKSDNPFSYFTQCCHFAFIGRLNHERKLTYSRMKYTQNFSIESDLSESSMSTKIDTMNDYAQGYVKEYEEMIEQKKERARQSELKKLEEATKEND